MSVIVPPLTVHVVLRLTAQCPPGTYLDQNTYQCTLCALGTASALEGVVRECEPCPAGTDTVIEGSLFCNGQSL